MDACALLITSIVAVKSEDQGTFFQDFLGLSGYLCSVPEMLRTTMKPNGLRPAPAGFAGVRALLGCLHTSQSTCCGFVISSP